MARIAREPAVVSVYTIGHSTRSVDEFLALLSAHGIRRVVDVRRYPGSRLHPQFGREQLERSLQSAGIGYRHEPRLGGRRTARRDSPNGAWRSASFRGYADHMASAEFAAALAQVLAEAAGTPTALLCAEAVPWRCHRQLIADALVARGIEVRHITGPGTPAAHQLHPAARPGPGLALTYPSPADQQGELL